MNGIDFDHPRFVPFYEKVVEHDLLVVVHPNGFTQGRAARRLLPEQYRRHTDGLDRLHRADREPSSYLAQMYLDTMVFDPEMISTLVKRWGADHVLLGTDYPFDMGETDPLGLLAKVEDLQDKERGLIAGGNAARLLGLDL